MTADLRERLMALATDYAHRALRGEHGHAMPDLAIAAARIALDDAAKVCDEYPNRDPAGDGNGYWAADECAAAVRALAEGIE